MLQIKTNGKATAANKVENNIAKIHAHAVNKNPIIPNNIFIQINQANPSNEKLKINPGNRIDLLAISMNTSSTNDSLRMQYNSAKAAYPIKNEYKTHKPGWIS